MSKRIVIVGGVAAGASAAAKARRIAENVEIVLIEAGGRPHWGKEFSFNPKKAYPEDDWNAFADLSTRWGSKFANAWSLHFSPAGDGKAPSSRQLE